MRLSDFDYYLPEELIAQQPAEKRDQSRLMVVNRQTQSVELQTFPSILDYLKRGDVLVINETKVIPCRMQAYKAGSASPIEIFLVREIRDKVWKILVKPGKKARENAMLDLPGGAKVKILSIVEEGMRLAEFIYAGNFRDYLENYASIPLPHYIDRSAEANDKERYQTVFAAKEGAVAAPTAGLHFTPELLNQITQSGVEIVRVVLHVGIGTFRPVKTEIITDHVMHSEYFEISSESATIINQTKKAGGRVFAVGTTSVRALESATGADGCLQALCGDTDIFIYPGYQFKIVDSLITNFHLPKSSLLMLVSAFAGYDLIKSAYSQAVENSFRFFSYGDAMLIV